jgi:hypothetical protein
MFVQLDEEEPFNPLFTEVERVLDRADGFALVKWRALPYEEATWEDETVIDSDKLDQFETLRQPDPLKAVQLIHICLNLFLI